jgi:IclR family transcriptional regulator, KDG regulon repressor
MEARDRSKAQSPKSFDLALRILGSFDDERRECGVSELARDFEVSKATIYRVLVPLEQHRYVVQNPVTGRYCLGSRLGLIVKSAGPRLDLAAEARPYIEQLRERTKEVVRLDVLDGNEVVVIARLDEFQPIQVMSRIGDHAPAHCISTGKAILAYASPQAFDLAVAGVLTRYTERTHTAAGSFSREFVWVRKAGFAVNWGEWRTEARGIHAAAVDSALRVAASFGICGPSTRLTEEFVFANAPAGSRPPPACPYASAPQRASCKTSVRRPLNCSKTRLDRTKQPVQDRNDRTKSHRGSAAPDECRTGRRTKRKGDFQWQKQGTQHRLR